MTKPNILWICADQQRWDTLSCLGTTAINTPNVDGLARAGVAFRRAYAQSPICTPSRASFLTGTYPICHQVQRNGNAWFPDHLPLVSRLFRDAGYRTGLIGKLHLSAAQQRIEQRPDDGYEEFYWSQHPYPDWPHGHDYHDWLLAKGVDPTALYAGADGAVRDGVPAGLHQTTWAQERAQDFIRRHRGTPWLLSVNLFDPHPPFDPPRAYFDRVDPGCVPPPLFRPSDLAHQARFAGVDQQAHTAVDPDAPYAPTCAEPPQGQSHDTPPSSYDAQRIRRAYYAMVLLIDDMVGALLSTLDETDQRRDTLVLFMSDHGEMLGDHGLIYKGCRFYEGLVHVPLVISYPARFICNAASDALVELVDIPATLLNAAGIDVPYENQGQPLARLLGGESALHVHKPYVLSEYYDALRMPGSVGSRASMYFDGRHKLNLYHDAAEAELFDLQSDPGEFEDLWQDEVHKDLKLDLLQKHLAAMMRVSGFGPPRAADY